MCLENSRDEIVDDGLLTITDQRIVYEGSAKTLTFRLEKLTSVRARNSNLMLGVSNRQTNSSFILDTPQYVERLVRELLAQVVPHTQTVPQQRQSDLRLDPILRCVAPVLSRLPQSGQLSASRTE